VAEVILGFDRLMRRVTAIRENVERPEPALEESGTVMLESVRQNFLAEGRPARWEALKPATLRYKKGPGILRETLRLFASLAKKLAGRKVAVGTNVAYGKYHQQGTSGGARRAFLLFQNEDVDVIGRIWAKHVARP
jgi:phage gpG-like protein